MLDENSDLDAEHLREVTDAVSMAVKNMKKSEREDDDALSELIRVTARRYFNATFDRKPQTRVHLVRV